MRNLDLAIKFLIVRFYVLAISNIKKHKCNYANYIVVLITCFIDTSASASEIIGDFSGQSNKQIQDVVQNAELPVWWNNQLGMDPVVLPGFQPLSIENHNVRLFARNYNWMNEYFPAQIFSQGTLLAKQMKLVIHLKNQSVIARPDKIVIVEQSPDHIVIEATGKPLPGLSISTTTRVEYDGVSMIRLRLDSDSPMSILGLDFEVDIQNSNFMEILGYKAKEIRKQKDRNDLLTLPYVGEFLNVVGFVDGERSFWWFADNAKGWIWNNRNVTEVIREKGYLKLRQKLVGNEWIINHPIIIDFNFLATPVKNIGSSWRSKRVAIGPPSKKQTDLGGTFKLWWETAFAHDAFPYSEYPKGIKDILTANDISVYPGLQYNKRKVRTDKQKYGIHWIPYFSAHVLSMLDPVTKKYRSEWEILPNEVFKDIILPFTQKFNKPVLTHRAQNYSNYLLWRFNEEIDRLNIEGIYLDHGAPRDSDNLQNGGWTDSNGKLQPSLDILGLRSFLKRLRTLFISKGKAGYIFVHDSNREIIPAYTFVYSLIDGEQYRSGRVKQGDYLDTIPLHEIRTRLSSKQYGIQTIWLPSEWTYHRGNTKWDRSEEQRIAYRRIMALALLHDVMDYPIGSHRQERYNITRDLDRFGIDQATFVGYWNQHNSVSVNNPHIKVSTYYRQDVGKYLFIVMNTSNKEVTTTLSFDIRLLELQDKEVQLRLEGKLLAQNLSSVSTASGITIPKKDFRWIILESKN